MKKVITLALLAIGMMVHAQTYVDLSGMTANVTLGQNCSASQTPQEFITTGDANPNGFNIHLKNAKLTITGNLNGGGSITSCGQSTFCVVGIIQNNPTFESGIVSCGQLFLPDFDLTSLCTYKDVKIYDLTGRYVGNTQNIDILPDGIYIVMVEGYKTRKILIQ